MTDNPAIIVPRRNFLIRALGFHGRRRNVADLDHHG